MSDAKASKTFDFGDGTVERSTFTDIESTADQVLAAGGSKGNWFERILHRPGRSGGVWVKTGVIAGVVSAVAAVLKLLLG